MWRTRVGGRGARCLCLLGVVSMSLGSGLTGAQADEGAGTDPSPVVCARLGKARDNFALTQAVRGAYRRLGDPRCQAVLSDFADPSGRTLQSVLDEEGLTPQEHLGRLLFYEGKSASGCRNPGVLAFTQPGSRVVYVCTSWFREAFATNPGLAEDVVIHESLHALGLGENPPSSQEITTRVAERCGR